VFQQFAAVDEVAELGLGEEEVVAAVGFARARRAGSGVDAEVGAGEKFFETGDEGVFADA
jgi:hypothetical protein